MIIKNYIQICNSSIIYGVVCSIFLICINILDGLAFGIYDTESLWIDSFKALEGIGALMVFITFLVVPTKMKLLNLLIDINLFDAEERDKLRRLNKIDSIKEGFVSDNKNKNPIGYTGKIKRWIYNSRTPVFRVVAIIFPFLIISLIILEVIPHLNHNRMDWNSSTAGGLYTSLRAIILMEISKMVIFTLNATILRYM